jgi:hypothetical protein
MVKTESEWNIDTASLSYGRDGSFIELHERPLWAVVVEMAGETVTSNLTGHLFCCNIPEWAWKLRWGPLDDDGWTDKNIGHCMYELGQWVGMGFGAWKQSRLVARLPVTSAWVREHYPDAGWPWDGSSPDEDVLTKPEKG